MFRQIFKTFLISSCLIASVAQAGDTKAALQSLKSILNKSGAPKIDGTDKAGDKQVPRLMFGAKKLNNNTDAVDEVKKRHGGTATIFAKDGDDFVRVTTNVLKEDGTRAIGTTLAHNKAYESVSKGTTFCGDVEILGLPYDTCYEPFKDSAGNIIGLFYVGFKK